VNHAISRNAGLKTDHIMSVTTPTEQLRGLVEYMAGHLVDSPDDIEVIAEERGSAVHVTLRVSEAAMGRVIGRQGRIAKAMRTIVMIAGSRHNVRASLDIEG
jgi:predicted RNA-binding protein YlqC (UPF0109 family)